MSSLNLNRACSTKQNGLSFLAQNEVIVLIRIDHWTNASATCSAKGSTAFMPWVTLVAAAITRLRSGNNESETVLPVGVAR